MSDPTGYAVVTADGYFVGIWRDREVAQKVLDRSPMAKGESIVECVPTETMINQVREVVADLLRVMPVNWREDDDWRAVVEKYRLAEEAKP
jgi:hypothetical protein